MIETKKRQIAEIEKSLTAIENREDKEVSLDTDENIIQEDFIVEDITASEDFA